MIDAALSYAERGWQVLPLTWIEDGACSCGSIDCKSPGKHPLTRDGARGASSGLAKVRGWWRRWPKANIGIATGPGSELWVLDLDTPKDGEADGAEALWRLQIEHGPHGGAEVVTGGGGRHLYFAWPEDGEVGSRARVLELDGTKASADTRGAGGYVVAPPSGHRSGGVYAWMGDCPAELAQAPAWLVEAVRPRPEPPRIEPPRAPLPEADPGDRMGGYFGAAVRSAVGRISGAAPGSRHGQILREAQTLGGWLHLVPAWSADGLAAELAAAGVAAGVPQRDAERTAREGVRWGEDRPRPAPELREPTAKKTRPTPEDPDAGDTDWMSAALDGEEIPEEVLDELPPLDDAAPIRARVRVRPQVAINMRQPSEVVADARRVLAGLRGEDRLYLRDGRPVHVALTEHGPAIREIGHPEVVASLLSGADWLKRRAPRKGEAYGAHPWIEEEADGLPGYLVPAILGDRSAWLPVLERVSSGPYYDAEGRLVRTEGYDEASRGYVCAGWLGQTLGAREALEVIHDWIGDFRFERASDLAHALAFALTPLVRSMIRGPVPITLFEAPQPGTGKSLLMQILATTATGAPVAPSPLSAQEDERRKAVTSLLAEGRPVVLLDNVRGRLQDPVLEAVLTAWPVWSDRLMGGQGRIRVPAAATWGLSGNNLEVGADMLRRAIVVRLNARVARPEQRGGFRHPDILGWTAANRDRLLGALVGLVAHWQALGSPSGSARLGSYEGWSAVVGGILEVAGVPGFLGDREAQAAASDPESAQWQALIGTWLADPGLRGRRTAGELARWCADRGLLLSVIRDGSALAQAQRMGRALQGLRGRVFGVAGRAAEVRALPVLHGSTSYEVVIDGEVVDLPASEGRSVT